MPMPLSPARRAGSGAVLATLLALAAPCAPAEASTLDTRVWVTNGRVNSVVRDGTTLYLGGSFSVVGPQTGGGVPVLASTGARLAGAPAVSGTVSAVVSDGAGGWFIGGSFDSVGAFARANLAHVRADLSVDPAWNPGTNGGVAALVLGNGVLYAGGTFTMAGGTSRQLLAAFIAQTGNLKTGWNPGASSNVMALTYRNGIVYAGGLFGFAGGQTRTYIAALDTVTGAATAWNPAPNALVNTIACADSTVYFGGTFVTVGGIARNRVAAVQTTTATLLAWDPAATGTVNVLLVDGTTVYAGGGFGSIGGQVRSRLGAVDGSTGLATAWNPSIGLNGDVSAIAVVGDTVYAGGTFTSYTVASVTTPRPYLAGFDRGTAALAAWNPVAGASALALAANGDTLYCGGLFLSVGGVRRLNLAAIDLATGSATEFDPAPAGAVNALVLRSGVLYAGGAFLSVGPSSVTRQYLAAFTPGTGALLPWAPTVSGGTVSALAAGDTVLYVGGSFTSVDAQTRNRLAAVGLAGGAVQSWNPNANTSVAALAFGSGVVFAAGNFTTIGGTSRPFLAGIDASSGALTSFNATAGAAPSALLVSAGTLYVGGFFSSMGGQSRSNIAALDAGTGLATAWNPGASSTVSAFALSGSTLYAGGAFATLAGVARARLAAVDVTSGVATAWNPNLTGSSVYSVTTGAGVLHAGGDFLTVGGVKRRDLATIVDSALTAGVPPGAPAIPPGIRLAAPAPSPARERATLRFVLARPGAVRIALFDAAGRRVAEPVRERWLDAGPHEIAVFRGTLRPGVYVVDVRQGAARASRRLVWTE